MRRELSAGRRTTKPKLGKVTPAPHGFVIEGGTVSPEDIAGLCRSRRAKREAAQAPIGAARARSLKAKIAARLQAREHV